MDPLAISSFLHDFEANKPFSRSHPAGLESPAVDGDVTQAPAASKAGSSQRYFRIDPPTSQPSETNKTSPSQSSQFSESALTSLTTPSTFYQPGPLPCEFAGFTDCQATFRIDDLQSWATHIAVAHLAYQYPRVSLCWFCDEVQFDAVSDNEHIRKLVFMGRLAHIRQHFVDGPPGPIRPDFYLLDHLKKCDLIGDELFEKAKEYNELPEQYRLPKDSTFGRPPGRAIRPSTVTVALPHRPCLAASSRSRREQRYYL